MLTTPADGEGADDLRKHLEDPMVDVVVWEDERKRVAKVEHVKLLRNHLEKNLAGVAEVISETTDVQMKKLAEVGHKVADMKHLMQEMFGPMQSITSPPAGDTS